MIHFHSQKSSTVTMNALKMTQFAAESGRECGAVV